MKRLLFGIFAVSLIVALGVYGSSAAEDDDGDVVLSDVPLTGLSKMDFSITGEHQSNDLGVVLYVIETRCDKERI